MKIKNVKFSYSDRKFGLGPYLEWFAELEVSASDYDSIVNAIQLKHPEYKDVKVMSFRHG
jgi:uncharacterized short protein YbdD (DUF466 family)